MIKNLERLLNKKSHQELKLFYCEMYGICECEKRDYVNHLTSYLRMYLRFHKNKKTKVQKIELINKAHKILKFINE